MRRARPRTVAAGRGLGGRDARRTRRPPNLSSLHDRCHVFLFRAPLTIHKHKNNSTADEARRPSRPEGCKLKLARRRSSPPRRDVTPDPVRATYGADRWVRVDTEVGFASDGHRSEVRASVTIRSAFDEPDCVQGSRPEAETSDSADSGGRRALTHARAPPEERWKRKQGSRRCLQNTLAAGSGTASTENSDEAAASAVSLRGNTGFVWSNTRR